MSKRIKKYDVPGHLHFVTMNVFKGHPVFNIDGSSEALLATASRLRELRGTRFVGYVVMPDHAHFIIGPAEGQRISSIVGTLRQHSARAILPMVEKTAPSMTGDFLLRSPRKRHNVRRLWQPDFFDFNIFSDRKLREHLDYMHNNPVRRELVSSPDQWRYASYRNYFLGDQSVFEVDKIHFGSRVKDPTLPELVDSG